MVVQVRALGTYQPSWIDERGDRVAGLDEDVATLAISAGLTLSDEHLDAVQQVALVTRRPDALLGTTADVVLEGLRLDAQTPVEERLGGAPAMLEALGSAVAGTLIVGVDPQTPSAAAAALIGDSGARLDIGSRTRFSVPVRIRAAGTPEDRVYDDPRLLREQGWRRTTELLTNGLPTVVTGVPDREAAKLVPGSLTGTPALEAAAPLFALTELLERGERGRVIALENGVGVALDLAPHPATTVARHARDPVEAPESWNPQIPAEIPVSIAAYERNFVAKVGFRAARCDCGELTYPPRRRCLACGQMDATEFFPLPRTGTVYSVVTVRTPVPGKTVPYTLAVVDVGSTPVRALVHVTDALAASVKIGDEGAFVLRRVAVRGGIPDYGVAFQPGGQR